MVKLNRLVSGLSALSLCRAVSGTSHPSSSFEARSPQFFVVKYDQLICFSLLDSMARFYDVK